MRQAGALQSRDPQAEVRAQARPGDGELRERVAPQREGSRGSIGRASLALLEVTPGVTVWDVLMRDWEGRDVNQIGRQPPLSPNKSNTHFPRLREATGVPYSEMLFFDDCNWTDHCTAVSRAHGVVAQRTPHGITASEWRRASAPGRRRASGTERRVAARGKGSTSGLLGPGSREKTRIRTTQPVES